MASRLCNHSGSAPFMQAAQSERLLDAGTRLRVFFRVVFFFVAIAIAPINSQLVGQVLGWSPENLPFFFPTQPGCNDRFPCRQTGGLSGLHEFDVIGALLRRGEVREHRFFVGRIAAIMRLTVGLDGFHRRRLEPFPKFLPPQHRGRNFRTGRQGPRGIEGHAPAVGLGAGQESAGQQGWGGGRRVRVSRPWE